MRYPITPDYLASAPDPLVKLYSDLETKILEDICRRFKLSGEATESAIAQIKISQERGYSPEDIEKVIRDTLKLSEKELDEIFDRAVDRNKQYYDQMIEKADIVSAEYKGLDREIAAIRKQTHDEFVNLTQSLGFAIRTGAKTEFLPIAKTYQKILDDAAAQVLSGGMDYNTAIKGAVKRLTDSGLQMVDYASGWHNRVDVAARRAVMTGVSQLSAQYAEQNAEILGTDLREVTAHSGARDTGTGWQNHKAWQGKVYSVSGTHPKYPSIYEVCGWGQVDGLEGANCRHHHFPFVDGVSQRRYTDEELKNIDPPPFEYQGKTYTAYEATQKQRQLETSMRKYKRDVIGYEAAGLKEDAQDAAIKLGRLSKEYKAFSKAAGLRTQPERAQVAGFGHKEAARASKVAEKRKNIFTHDDERVIIKAISGARITNVYGTAAEAHADRYYGLVRSMQTDISVIAKNTGYSEDIIRRIKNYIFIDEHDLGDGLPRRFDPSFAMAQSWQRLINGTPEPHDLTLLNHEIFEKELMDTGMSQYEAHIEATRKYNYTKESDDYYAALKERKNRK